MGDKPTSLTLPRCDRKGPEVVPAESTAWSWWYLPAEPLHPSPYASTLPLLLSWAGYGYNTCWVTDCLEQIRVTLDSDAELEQWGTSSARAINDCFFFVQARSVWWSHSWVNIWTQIFTQFSISSAREKQIKEHFWVIERQPQRFALQRDSSPCKWNHQFFIKVQVRFSICPNSTERAEKLELGFVYCHVLSAATFVQISSEDGGKKKRPSLN